MSEIGDVGGLGELIQLVVTEVCISVNWGST